MAINFDRRYVLKAGQSGSNGFEIGEGEKPLRISFRVSKCDTMALNNGKIAIWNLNPQHIAELNKKDCAIELRAGYGDNLQLIFTGIVTFVKTTIDGADMKTEIEVTDNRISMRDTYVSVSYNGKISCKKLIEDVAKQMGLTLNISYDAEFGEIPDGFSYVGQAANVLTKACDTSNLTWAMNNGIIHIKKPGGTLTNRAYELSAKTGLLGIPEKVVISKSEDGYWTGWDVVYLMNAAIDVDDYVYLNSRFVNGYFKVYSVDISGDNYSGEWACKARLLERE